mgnify:CR=1 FL=1
MDPALDTAHTTEDETQSENLADGARPCCRRQDAPAEKPCCRRRGGRGAAFVEPAALAALLFAGSYGYDMRRTILEMTDGRVDADVGGLYRSLRKLEAEDYVISRWVDDENGPRKREYELTAQGRELAEQWCADLRQRQELSGILADLIDKGLNAGTDARFTDWKE